MIHIRSVIKITWENGHKTHNRCPTPATTVHTQIIAKFRTTVACEPTQKSSIA